MLIVLTALLSSHYTAIAQVDSSYCFTPSEIKDIAYRIKSRELLMQDTSILRSRIKNLELLLTIKDSSILYKDRQLFLDEIRISTLTADVGMLEDEVVKIGRENKKLTKQIKIFKNSLPIAFLVGSIVTLLIVK